MELRVWALRAALVVSFLLEAPPAAGEAAAAVCPRATAVGSILGPPEDLCLALDGLVNGGEPISVVEGDESALQRALSIVHKSREDYVAVLFYASWCPFSKLCRLNFSIMSSLFPTIRHFAFEESFIRTSTLSRYGVHGFPTLFLLNSTMRVRYRGSRTINSLVAFYNDVTGVRPASMDSVFVKKAVLPFDHSAFKEDVEHENCPFSWARSPEKLLQQDTYLALASIFLVLRILYFLLPKVNACLKHAWMHMNENLEQAKQGVKRLNPCKRSNLQGGAINAKAWASKSLASVSIGEPSSNRTRSMGERR